MTEVSYISEHPTSHKFLFLKTSGINKSLRKWLNYTWIRHSVKTKKLLVSQTCNPKVASSSLGPAGIVGGGSESTALFLHP